MHDVLGHEMKYTFFHHHAPVIDDVDYVIPREQYLWLIV
jgi:hypothetical protein